MSTEAAGLLPEVQQLLASYCHAIDTCDAAAWAAVFHPDGTSAGPGRPTLRGTEQLRAFIEENPRPDVFHLVLNTYVDRVEGDRVWVTSNFVCLRVDASGGFSVLTAGRYADVLERRDGVLKIASRVAVADRRAPAIDTNDDNH